MLSVFPEHSKLEGAKYRRVIRRRLVDSRSDSLNVKGRKGKPKKQMQNYITVLHVNDCS